MPLKEKGQKKSLGYLMKTDKSADLFGI
jgi:hypothetical protein